jgi:ferric-dicitrate binding protein FerR (iron transport regulator)
MEKRDYKDYEHCGSREFICDPFFQEWIVNPTAEGTEFWKEFLLRYPAAAEKVEVAKTFLQGIAFREEFPDERVVAASFEKHWEIIQGITRQEPAAEDESEHAGGHGKVRRMWKIAAAAIVVGVLLTIGLTWYFSSNNGQQLHETQYGQTRQVLLPDGSTVMLNARSSLEYKGDWNDADVREVWLKGEGYFSVKKAFRDGDGQRPQKFRVHTADLVVEVLGTTFDIRERRGVTEVVLGTGSIELVFRNQAHGTIRMKPGDRVVYDPRQQQQVLQDTANATDYSAWQQNKLILKNPTVREIARYLEDNFGYRIELEDQRMGSKIITGPILYDSLDDALFILSTVLNTQIIKKDSTIILRPR